MTSLYCHDHCLSNVEAIVFDKDGTLADSRCFLEQLAQVRSQLCAEAMAKVMAAQIKKSSADLYQDLLAIFGVNPSGLNPDGLMAVGTRQANESAVTALLIDLGYPSDLATALITECFVRADQTVTPKAPHTPPFEGTQVLLQQLSHHAIPIGVLSSDSPTHVEEFLAHYQLLPWVNEWQGTEPEDVPKPDPELLYRLCDRLGVGVANTLIVGDSWVDLALAEAAGAAGFISVSERWGRPPVAGASLVISTWEDLSIRG